MQAQRKLILVLASMSCCGSQNAFSPRISTLRPGKPHRKSSLLAATWCSTLRVWRAILSVRVGGLPWISWRSRTGLGRLVCLRRLRIRRSPRVSIPSTGKSLSPGRGLRNRRSLGRDTLATVASGLRFIMHDGILFNPVVVLIVMHRSCAPLPLLAGNHDERSLYHRHR